MNKTLKVMSSAAMLAGVVAPVAVTSVDANSTNYVSKVIYVDDDYSTPTGAADNYIVIKEDDIPFTSGDTFRLSLPSGVKWVKSEYTAGTTFTAGSDTAEVVAVTDSDLELKMVLNDDATDEDFQIPLFFEVDGAEGEVKLTVDPRGTTVTGGQYTIAVVSDGATATSIASVKTIGSGNGEIADIRIDETAIGALGSSEEITLTLPPKLNWVNTAGTVTLAGGFVNAGATVQYHNGTTWVNLTDGTTLETDNFDGKTLKFRVNGQSTNAPGTIYVKGLQINPERDANYGDVTVDVSGDSDATSEDLLVAKYSDYDTTVEIGDLPTLVAGRNNEDTDELKLAKITLKEDVPGSWVTNREVEVEFPSWVKVVGVETTDLDGFNDGDATIQNALASQVEADSNVVEFDVPAAASSTSKRELTIQFFVSVEADAEGDITAAVSGKAGIEGEFVLGKAVSPVSVEVTPADVKTGIKNQKLNDIVITEASKGALIENGQVRIWLGDDVEFSGTPDVEVTDGNLEIDDVDVTNGVLTFNIDSESTKASTITISNLEATLDRTIPEGDITVKIGGTALVVNDEDSVDFDAGIIGDNNWVASDVSSDEFGKFEKDYVAKEVIATVVTPAEGNVSAQEVKFTLGSTTYTVGGVEKAMDVAPFVEGGRTFMPIRYVAEAVGADFITWDQATQTATIMKGDRVVQLTAGSNALKVNGASIAMDAAAQVKDGRTVLPVRFVGQALGAQVDWNADDQTVTVK